MLCLYSLHRTVRTTKTGNWSVRAWLRGCNTYNLQLLKGCPVNEAIPTNDQMLHASMKGFSMFCPYPSCRVCRTLPRLPSIWPATGLHTGAEKGLVEVMTWRSRTTQAPQPGAQRNRFSVTEKTSESNGTLGMMCTNARALMDKMFWTKNMLHLERLGSCLTV